MTGPGPRWEEAAEDAWGGGDELGQYFPEGNEVSLRSALIFCLPQTHRHGGSRSLKSNHQLDRSLEDRAG